MTKRSAKPAHIGYVGKKKDGGRWVVLNQVDSKGNRLPFETINDAKDAGATKFTPMFA